VVQTFVPFAFAPFVVQTFAPFVVQTAQYPVPLLKRAI